MSDLKCISLNVSSSFYNKKTIYWPMQFTKEGVKNSDPKEFE